MRKLICELRRRHTGPTYIYKLATRDSYQVISSRKRTRAAMLSPGRNSPLQNCVQPARRAYRCHRRHFAYEYVPFPRAKARYPRDNSRIRWRRIFLGRDRRAKRRRPEGRVSRKPANVISSTFYWRETDFKALSHLDLIARPRYTVGRTFWLGRREKRKGKIKRSGVGQARRRKRLLEDKEKKDIIILYVDYMPKMR